MKLPFTFDEFMQVFSDYNTSVFPLQVLFYILVIIAGIYLVKKDLHKNKIISIVLSFLWLWMGVVYHLIYFTTINIAAYLFGAIFILQGLLFLWTGVYQKKLHFELNKTAYGLAGIILILFSTGVYPLLSYLMGHIYPASPTFGLPCPTTIFSFGLLLFVKKDFPAMILVIPFLWSIVGFAAAFTLGMYEDISLIIASVSSVILLLRKKIVYEKI